MYIQYFKRAWSVLLCKQFSKTFVHYYDTKSTALHCNYTKINEKFWTEIRFKIFCGIIHDVNTDKCDCSFNIFWLVQYNVVIVVMNYSSMKMLITFGVPQSQQTTKLISYTQKQKQTKLLQYEVGSTLRKLGCYLCTLLARCSSTEFKKIQKMRSIRNIKIYITKFPIF